ncbi:MAG: hypothetical protein IKY23_10855 [Lachnospiraceae bacterium]|nr:hypothetical protein [Lachnospiraceae bacterium]
MDKERFLQLKDAYLKSDRNKAGIGTLKEKTVHAILKDYYAPDKDMQEVPINGYVADIYTGEEIIEIQTANFNKMRQKLDSFLPEYPVTLVYPIPHVKWLSWMDEETGECSPLRKSPKKGNVYHAFYELYKIKQYLNHPNLRLCFPLLDIEEYRLLNGWSKDKKKGSERFDRIPVALVDEVCICRIEDYMQLIPYELEEPFTVSEFAKAAKIRKDEAQTVVHILHYLKLIERCGKKGRSYAYIVKEI